MAHLKGILKEIKIFEKKIFFDILKSPKTAKKWVDMGFHGQPMCPKVALNESNGPLCPISLGFPGKKFEKFDKNRKKISKKISFFFHFFVA